MRHNSHLCFNLRSFSSFSQRNAYIHTIMWTLLYKCLHTLLCVAKHEVLQHNFRIMTRDPILKNVRWWFGHVFGIVCLLWCHRCVYNEKRFPMVPILSRSRHWPESWLFESMVKVNIVHRMLTLTNTCGCSLHDLLIAVFTRRIGVVYVPY
jgi:hypothetical protein